MALNDQITGNVTGKIKFTIDKSSWNNLDKFQKKLTSVKKQMSNMDKTINVNAVVKTVEKVANAQIKATERVAKVQKKAAKEGYGLEFGRARGSNKDYANWWKEALAIQDKGLKESIRQQKANIKQQQQMVKGANANAGMAGRLSWMFPSGSIGTKASSTVFAQMLRDEDKAARDYNRRLEQAKAKRAKANAARRKRKMKGVSSSTAFEDSVNAFMEVKYSQVRKEAIRKGYANTQLEQDNLARVKAAADQNFRDNFGNIKQFRSNVNTVVGEMLTMERTARMNRITFASLRGELVQLTAAYGAFAVTQNVASTGMRFNF